MNNVEMAKPFIQATISVLSAMCQITPQAGTPFVKKDKKLTGDVTVFVNISGEKQGTILLSFPKACAITMVKNMFGDEIEDIMAETKDAVGEIANIISGQARASLVDLGLTLAGSTPFVVYGHTTDALEQYDAATVVIPFTTADSNTFTLEFCIA